MSFFINNQATTGSADPVEQVLIGFNDSANFNISNNVLSSSSLFTVIQIIANDVASCKLNCDTPNIGNNFSKRRLLFPVVSNMLLYGNSFVENLGNGNFRLVPNNHIEIEYDDVTNQVRYKYDNHEQKPRYIPNEKLLHFFEFTKNGVFGLSRVQALKGTLKAEKELNNLLGGYLTTGIHGTTVIKSVNSDLSREAREKVRKSFDEATTGDKALNSIVVGPDLDVSSLDLNTDVLNVIDKVNSIVIRRIASTFGLPIEKLGLENVHSNALQSDKTSNSYLRGTLQHIFDCITSELTEKLGNKNFSFDTSALTSVDPKEMLEQAANAYNNGLITLDEARQMINLDPVGNTYFKE